MEQLFEFSRRKINKVSSGFIRFMMPHIDWDQKLIGITGARGCGKTTFLLQRITQMHIAPDEVLYISLDNPHLLTKSLFYIADDFVKMGGKYLFLDEVHKYPQWSSDIKNIYDTFHEIKIVFTGSSALNIYKGSHDLSRRALLYSMPGLSFREFIQLEHNISFKAFTLNQIITDHAKIEHEINSKIKPVKLFREYLSHGFYPFFKESKNAYHEKLLNVLSLVIESDLPGIFNMDYKTVIKMKKLMVLLADMVPFTPNIDKLARQVETTRDNLLKQLYYLDKAQIVKWMSSEAQGINYLNKPEKLYLHNPNLFYALSSNVPETGSLRESFFLSQVSVNHKVTIPKKGDFLVDGKKTFETGGKSKTAKQVNGLKNAYVVKDNLEYGSGNNLPLWLFGFLY